jgi:LPS export ABC transporter protein LptC
VLFRFITVFAMIALCAITWILSSPMRGPLTTGGGKPPELPGYYLKNAVLTDYDLAGKPSVRIEAERIEQIAHGNEVALYNVRVAYQSPGEESWTMVGDVAHIEPGGNVIDVKGNVQLQGESTGQQAAAVVHTDTLQYDIPDAVATTKDDVRIDFAQHTLTARGFRANFKERTLRLESKVNGRFHP